MQTNHGRQTAAISAKLGLRCIILLEHRVDTNDPDYERNGNVLLDRLYGAELRDYPGGGDMNAAMEPVAEEVRKAGGKPYLIPGGGSNTVGALGYVNCAHGADLPGERAQPAHRPCRARHRQRRHPGGPCLRLRGAELAHPSARHRRPRAQAQAGGERPQARPGDGREDGCEGRDRPRPASSPTATMWAAATACRPTA